MKIDLTVLLNTEVKTACFGIMFTLKPELPMYLVSLDLCGQEKITMLKFFIAHTGSTSICIIG